MFPHVSPSTAILYDDATWGVVCDSPRRCGSACLSTREKSSHWPSPRRRCACGQLGSPSTTILSRNDGICACRVFRMRQVEISFYFQICNCDAYLVVPKYDDDRHHWWCQRRLRITKVSLSAPARLIYRGGYDI